MKKLQLGSARNWLSGRRTPKGSPHQLSDYTSLIFFSVILGMAAGLTAVGLHEFIHLMNNVFLPADFEASFPARLPYWIIFIPAGGMLIQWLMAHQFPQQAKQKGVVDVIKSVSFRNGFIPLKSTLFHFLAPAVCMGTGGTVGPEAPAAQSGAGVVSALGQLFRLKGDKLRIFTAAGAGAAIAGVFNTPLAGVFFGIEVILLNDLHASALTAFILSSVSASAVSRAFLGNQPKFIFGELILGSYSTFVFYLLLGLGAGLLSTAFIQTSEFFQKTFARLYQRKISPLLVMISIGLLMGAAGWWKPEILGIGYTSINKMLAQSFTGRTVLILFLLKFFLVIFILRSGGFGGIFAPSMFLGACYGFIFAQGLNILFHLNLDPTTYTLVGMGAMLAGINSVPITAILILFEMTNNYYFILPLMLGTVGSHVVTHMALRGSIYLRELRREGYTYAFGRDLHILRSIRVREVARPDILLLPESTPSSEVIKKFLDSQHDTIYVVNAENQITGVIKSNTLRYVLAEYEQLHHLLLASDIADPDVVFLRSDDTLEEAMKVFAHHRVEEIPVLDSENPRHIIGTLHYQDVLNAYNQLLNRLNLAEGLASEFKTLQEDALQEVIPGFSLAEVDVPEEFAGKSIGELQLRNKYRIDVLMVEEGAQSVFAGREERKKQVMPDKDYVLHRDDRLIIYGRTLDVVNFKKIAEQV